MNNRKHTGKHRTSEASPWPPVPEAPDPIWTPDSETETGSTDSEREAEDRQREELVKAALEPLTPRKRAIVTYYFGLEDAQRHSQKETGEKFSISKQRVSQIIHEMKEMLEQKKAQVQTGQHSPDR